MSKILRSDWCCTKGDSPLSVKNSFFHRARACVGGRKPFGCISGERSGLKTDVFTSAVGPLSGGLAWAKRTRPPNRKAGRLKPGLRTMPLAPRLQVIYTVYLVRVK